MEGGLVIVEERPDGILLRPAIAMAADVYSPERRAAFVMENAVDEGDYAAARKAVAAMGLNPDAIPHKPPAAMRPPTKRTKRARS